MSTFFQQLVARHQGGVDTVQPWIPNRFAVDVSDPVMSAPPWGETAVDAAAPCPAPVHATPVQPLPSISSSVNETPIQPLPSISSRSAPPDHPPRLETVTRWIHQVEHESLVVNRSTLSALPTPETTVVPSTAPVAPPSVAQPQAAVGQSIAPSVSSVEHPVRSPAPPIHLVNSPARSPSLAPAPLFNPPEPITPVQPALPPLLAPSPTIRVNIGRVEIRATPPAPAAPVVQRRTTPVQRPTLSLDAYLHQRNRRS